MESLFTIDTGRAKVKKREKVRSTAANVFSLTDGIDFENSSWKKKTDQTLETSERDVFSDILLKENILRPVSSIQLREIGSSSSVNELMKKSVITPGLEKCDAIPMPETSKNKLSKLRKLERSRTKGAMWFNMPAPEVTEEMKHDLEVLQMRSVLDPKHFYKKNDLKVLPKYFQVGRVIETPADFYHSRIPKKMRKKTIVEELLADADFQKYNKKRYKEIIEERRKTHFKAHKQAKKLKKNKRRH